MAKVNPTVLRAEMLASVQSIDGYLKNVKRYIKTAETSKIQNNYIAIDIELQSIKKNNTQLAAI